jgi:aldose 1-epimerase
VGRFDVRLSSRWDPIFQTAPDAGRTGAFALGCFLLIPFSNRISGGGFHHSGRFHALAPNLPYSQYPTHGNAFSLPWSIRAVSTHSVTLDLASVGPGPFRYSAGVRYTLNDTCLGIDLLVRNDGPADLPFGLGLHPWFVRTPLARLSLFAQGFWSEDADHLPDSFHPAGTGTFDFRDGAPLPSGWINSAFTGWDGRARLEWPERQLAVEIEAEPPLTTAIVFAPSPDRAFVCIEPVSHSVDAHNSNAPGIAPPQILQAGETLRARTLIRAMPLAPACPSPAQC